MLAPVPASKHTVAGVALLEPQSRDKGFDVCMFLYGDEGRCVLGLGNAGSGAAWPYPVPMTEGSGPKRRGLLVGFHVNKRRGEVAEARGRGVLQQQFNQLKLELEALKKQVAI